jgi:hypothetical protein
VKHIKTCSECKTDKEATSFYNNKNTKDGKDGRCIECQQKRNKKLNAETNHITNPIHNPKNMYVNGKYVSRKHPLYRAGNYKTFEGAAFSSFEKYESSTEGEVYILTNPAWKGWFKVGMAIDSEDRCRGYQTSSPLRDYKIEYRKEFKDRRSAESTAHRRLKRICKDFAGEWFYTNINKVKEVIESI